MTDIRRGIATERMRNTRLDGPLLDTVTDVVRWFGGMQFQEYPVARWSIGQRTSGIDEAAVDRALAAGEVIRTHVLRDTWHLVAASDLRWLMALTGPRIQQRNGTMYRRLELDERQLARTDQLLAQALAGGQQLPRRAIAAYLSAHGVDADGMRLAYVLMHAEVELVICSGALQGKQQTYALVDDLVPPTRGMDRDEALVELVRRYFTSHGPATVKDLGWWSSLTAADIRHGLERVGDALEERVIDGVSWWSAPTLERREAPPRAHLLQGYDEYVIAYSETRNVLDIDGHAGSVLGGDAMFTHAVLLDGQVIGHWRRRTERKAIAIDMQLGCPLDPASTQALDDAVQRYGTFAGSPISWSVTPGPARSSRRGPVP